MTAGVVFGNAWAAPVEKFRSVVDENLFESIGGLWPAKDADKPNLEVSRHTAIARRGADSWKHKPTAVVVDPPAFVRADDGALAPNDAKLLAWHEARTLRTSGQRILPAHTARKVGR
ncbi:hypothetical protein [Nannocystis sp.]|uniref:hypothetical protein n=1 Tax=Nannocystis sp. TaxID=1962667 RepID=UPI0025E33B05|nr:hypothetical protein [Nannocystis sp.]MBK7828398.1 hypothetical protein [Nannocystis sp.]